MQLLSGVYVIGTLGACSLCFRGVVAQPTIR
jgi:hypothetical protein